MTPMLSPVMLWGLLAVSVPIIILSPGSGASADDPVLSCGCSRPFAQRTRRLSRVENLLLLVLRCLLLALLALAFAEPAIRSSTMFLPGGNVEATVVFIVDNSMSMNLTSTRASPV